MENLFLELSKVQKYKRLLDDFYMVLCRTTVSDLYNYPKWPQGTRDFKIGLEVLWTQ